MNELRDRVPFGNSFAVDLPSLRASDEYHTLGDRDKALIEGWICGCPITQALTAPESDGGRGAAAMYERYAEVNDMFRYVATKAAVVNHDLFEQLVSNTPRNPDEPAYLFEKESTPANYGTDMPPIGSLPGYAIPRILLEVNGPSLEHEVDIDSLLDQMLRASSTPIDLLAMIAGSCFSAGMDAKRILYHSLGRGWIEEHTATSMTSSLLEAMRLKAPKLWEIYRDMSAEEKNSERLHNDFATEIGRRSTFLETASKDTLSLSRGDARVAVRARGGFITEWVPTTSTKSILFCPDDTSVAKLSASHPMSPVGPNQAEPGGQHGPERWADFHRLPSADGELSLIAMQVERSDTAEPSFNRSVELPNERTLLLNQTRTSNSSREHGSSIGEHLYFSCPEDRIDQIVVNGKPLAEYTGDPQAAAHLLEDETLEVYYPATDDEVLLTIQIPELPELQMSAKGHIFDENGTVHDQPLMAIAIWHRKGTDSICIEPLCGYDHGNNRAAIIPGFGKLQLVTKIVASA
ncbi:MAG: hypothetical protein WAW62_03265 [Candidatus Saccharimonas aalborgensis]